MSKHQSAKARSNPFEKAKVLYDNVVVKPIVVTAMKGVKTPQQYEDKPEFGEVVAIGAGRLLPSGTVVPLKVKVGDKIYFEKYSSVRVRIEAEDYLIIREEDIRIVF